MPLTLYVQRVAGWICRLVLPWVFTVAGFTGFGFTAQWPQFRGPDGQGHSDAVGVPLTWSESESVVWKTPLPGQGWSSPVVWEDQVWMTSAGQDGKSLHALCVEGPVAG